MKTYPTYTKRPDVVEAIQWTYDNTDDVLQFGQNDQGKLINENPLVSGKLNVLSKNVFVDASYGDYIVKDKDGTLTVLSKDEFEDTYESSKPKAKVTETPKEEKKTPAQTEKTKKENKKSK